jgi:aspartate/methionine/tyrosine aminotransferase
MPASRIALAARTAKIAPFQVMELMKRAFDLEASGRSIIHMSIGEPDFTAPPAVLRALESAMANGRAQYTAAVGLRRLRESISEHYRSKFDASVSAERIIITAGASGALLLTMATLIGAGDEILLPDPSYPCNRHFVSAFDGIPKLIPVGAKEQFHLTESLVRDHWSASTKGVLITTPSNPTGTSIGDDELRRIIAFCHAQSAMAIVDEIYQGLTYDGPPKSVLAYTQPNDPVIVINSFSKYFNMTGWRLGWAVVPEALIPVFERLSQNLFICASALAQHAALACFEPDTLALYEARREEFKKRRDYIVPALRSLGFSIPVMPDGAFYVYADCSMHASDSHEFALDLLESVGVAVVPGRDFGHAEPERWLRLSYATPIENLEEAVARIGRFLVDRRNRERAA